MRIETFRRALLLAALLLAASCASAVRDESRALEALSSPDARRRADALAFLLREPHDRRVELGLELFFSPDPFLGNAGVALLASTGPAPEAMEKILPALDDDTAARRFAALCVRAPDAGRLPLLLSLMRRLPDEDAPLLARALEAAAGVSLGGPEIGKAELCRRWSVWLAMRERGEPPEVLGGLADLWRAEDDYGLVAALRRLGPEGVVAASAEVLRIARSRPAVGREAALLLEKAAGDAALPLLAALLESGDYLTRYNALHALERLTGMKFAFDPAAPADERAADLRSLRRRLGLDR